MRKILLSGVAVGVSVLAALPAAATPLAGKSLNNVVVNGQSYTVNFFDSALANTPAPQNTLTTFASASSAINAITSSSAYTALVVGATASTYDGFIVAYGGAFGPAPLQYNGARYSSVPTPSVGNFQFYYNASNNPNTTGDYTFVNFAIAQLVAVPEPASFALVTLGLFGLGWARRRFN